MSFYPKQDRVMERSLRVQRLSIPLKVTHNATPASKVVTNDEASVLFINAQGVTQITIANGALDAGEATPTFDLSAADSTGDLNMLVKIQEQIDKIQNAQVIDRVTGATYACYTNSSNPPLSADGDKLLLNCHSGVNLASTDLDACLVVEYTTKK